MDLRTRHLNRDIRELYGDDQVDLFRFSLRALHERIEFASYHLEEIGRLMLPFTSSGGPGRGRDPAFEISIRQTAAHVTACCQSLHATGDICAHALFYAFALNISEKPLKAKDISAKNVNKLIPDTEVRDLFSELTECVNFNYIEALVNRSKHRSVVSTVYAFEAADSAEKPSFHGPKILRFEHHAVSYPAQHAEVFLRSELARQKKVLEQISTALERMTRARWEQKN